MQEKDGVSRVSYGVFFPEGKRKRTCQLKKTTNLSWCTMRPIFLLQRIFLPRSTFLGVELSQFLNWFQGSSLTLYWLEIFVIWVFRLWSYLSRPMFLPLGKTLYLSDRQLDAPNTCTSNLNCFLCTCLRVGPVTCFSYFPCSLRSSWDKRCYL